MKRIKRILCAIMAFCLVGSSFGGIISVDAVDGDGPTVKNDPKGPTIMDDGVRLHKTAKAVPGYANEWEVTLKIEAPPVDTVIVIDRSMSDTMLSNAKVAATSLAEELLSEGNTVNRVAVITFGTGVENKSSGFSDSFSVINNAINGVQYQEGGTFTQGAIHAAAQLLAGSDATYKNIVLLSDGVPSYSYGINNVEINDFEAGHEMIGGNRVRQFKIMDSSSKYNYSNKVGDGSSGWFDPDGREMWDTYGYVGGRRAYYNHGNSAIAEANFFKNAGGTIHTIAYNAGILGNDVLGQMASQGKTHTSIGEDLENIFKDIAGEIKSLVGNIHVHDVMGEGVYIDNSSHAEVLDWTPNFTFNNETGMFEDTKTYRVSANEHMLDEQSVDGFHPLNKTATITYNGKTGYFPTPKAKPFFINVTKQLVGQETNGQIFSFELLQPDNKKTMYQVEAGKTRRIVEPFPIGSYSISETGTSNNTIAFENYLTNYAIDGRNTKNFQINEQHADHINITMTNTYETIDVGVEKRWDDDNDRDGKRANYRDLAIAVKDGDKYVAYETLDITGNKSYSFDGLPKNRNGSVINYVVVEANGCSGTSDAIVCRSDFTNDNNYEAIIKDNVITNKHIPDTVTLTIKKKWDTSAGTLPTITPEFVTVEVSNDKNNTVETVTLRGESYTEWTGTFEGLKYENGQEIKYTVTEKKIGNNGLNADNTLYVYNNKVLEGKWIAAHSGIEVTNTWTPAKTVYTGAGEFVIKKLDQDNRAIPGVTFKVGDKEYITGDDGTVKIEFSKSAEKPEDKYSFNIKETDAPKFYDIIAGTEVLEVTTGLGLEVNEESLTNKYTKSFDFAVKTAVDGYVWQNNNSTLLVTNQALADKLEIEKTFEGISAKAFEEKSKIKFDISGPKGFTNMTIGNGDDECKISNSKLICIIDGSKTLLPVGEYTITEKDADITNFTHTAEPTNGEIKKTVELGGVAEFKFKNIYEPIKTASFKVKKIWKDDSDRDGIRPDSLEVTLLADGEVYGSPVDLTGDNWEYEWTKLPLVNKDATEIVYSAKEENLGEKYESDGGEMKNGIFTFTNTHEPEKYNNTGKLIVKKIWAGEGNELVRPSSVLVGLFADGKIIETASVMPGQNGEWTWTFSDLYKNANGKEIVYSVQELAIGETRFGEDESTIVVYEADGKILSGKWVKNVEEFEVTNTWTSAAEEIIYGGVDKFEITKTDENGKSLPGVVFTIGDTNKTTDGEGKIEINVPISRDLKKQTIEFEISEKETLDGYESLDGLATITVNCTSELAKADEENLVNRYIKTCDFKEEGDDAFVWTKDEDGRLTLSVVNLRSLANSLTIVKKFSGIDAAKLEGLTFTISGPEDFGDEGKIELSFSDDCIVDGSMAICEVLGRIPTGEYTVKEGNSEIDNYILTVTGDGEIQVAEKDADVVFEIMNDYKVIDPCKESDCSVPSDASSSAETPKTGSLTRNKKPDVIESTWLDNIIVGCVILLTGHLVIVFTDKYKKRGNLH